MVRNEEVPIAALEHFFLDIGHTQNENDTVHATMTNAAKPLSIYTPEQWYMIARMARRRHP